MLGWLLCQLHVEAGKLLISVPSVFILLHVYIYNRGVGVLITAMIRTNVTRPQEETLRARKAHTVIKVR